MSSLSRRHARVVGGLPCPTWREWATIWSIPAVLLVVHFLIQPAFDVWVRFKYVQYTVAQTAPPHRFVPEPFVPYAWAWHELTRIVHLFVHAPGAYHTHVLGNVVLIVLTAWALFTALTVLGHRRRFAYLYWELVFVAPVIGSFAFDLFGQTATGYGASTIGFSFLGTVAVVSAFVLVRELYRRLDEQVGRSRPVRFDGGQSINPLVVAAFLFATVGVVIGDIVVASPAMPVHQAGVGFGVLIGAVVIVAPLRR